MKKIKYCEKCKEYTLDNKCSACNSNTILKTPPKYSPDDKYSKYRRETKKKDLKEKGIL